MDAREAAPVALSRYLARRLAPLTLAVGLFVSFVPPVTFFVIEWRALTRTAHTYADVFANEMSAFIFETSTLWKYSADKASKLVSHFLVGKDLDGVAVRDEYGVEVAGLHYDPRSSASRFPAATGHALVRFNNRTLGTIEVRASGRQTILRSLAFFAASALTGIGLAVVLYVIPTRVVRRAEGQIDGLVAALDRRAVEATALARTLAQRNAELDSFVRSISHDIRSPLVSIQGLAGMLLEDHAADLGADGLRHLHRIRDNVTRMAQLTADLLALIRIGRDTRAAEPVPLNSVVAGVLVELAPLIAERRVVVTTGELGSVVAIRTELEQVFRNLVANAVKYLGDAAAPAIAIGVTARDGQEDEIFVRDNGIGIDRAYHDTIFQPFARLHDVPVEGTGLGLNIVKKVVEGAGGRVWVESERRAGATFRFTWPIRRVAGVR